jgi:hypothetical protein
LGRSRKTHNDHHRFPKSLGGTYTYPEDNISVVPKELHAAWHTIMFNKNAQQIARELNETWLPLGFRVKAIKKKD